MDSRMRFLQRRGLSLFEMLAVVVIIGVLAAMIVPRFGTPTSTAKKNACGVNKGNIEIQAQLWYRNKGVWPTTNLSDIGADQSYLPAGVPTCPVDGTAYTFNSTTQSINGHTH